MKISQIIHLKKKKKEHCGDLTIGLIKRSYLGGFRVKPSPTKQTLVTIRFQAFFCLFPVLMTLSTSVSPWARTLGRGTSHFPYREGKIIVDWVSDNVITLKHSRYNNYDNLFVANTWNNQIILLASMSSWKFSNNSLPMYNFAMWLLYHAKSFADRLEIFLVWKTKAAEHLQPSPSSSVWSCWRGL